MLLGSYRVNACEIQLTLICVLFYLLLIHSIHIICSSPQVFGPAFRRNSRWSVDPKVPDVGDEKTPYEQVDKFYDFWFAFK